LADYKVNVLVIGAGVIGLAVARELALAGREVIVAEAENSIGTGISSRNSEVIHAGIYYQHSSLKAKTCVQGKALLYRYCKVKNVPHKRCGKLIVATHSGQLAQLRDLQSKAKANDVTDLQFLDARQLDRLEPDINAVGALLSPSTGIIDSHNFMLNLQGDIESAGGWLVLGSPVVSGEVSKGQNVLTVGGDQTSEVAAEVVINAAGLQANQLLTHVKGFPPQRVRPLYLAKGNYFTLSGKSSFEHLIYPLPEPGGLGIHLTLDLAGQARFGPDVEWVNDLDYDVQERKESQFREAIRHYWPGIDNRNLTPAYSGIRPKLKPQGGGVADFVVETPRQHGVAGWYNLLGIESPGLTASLALARYVGAIINNSDD
jgi:L-2-hydroxyglutarate oxidase LhgO